MVAVAIGLLSGAVIALVYLVGRLWSRLNYLEGYLNQLDDCFIAMFDKCHG